MGLLLEAYAFWHMGQIALFAAIACFAVAVAVAVAVVMAVAMLIVTVLGSVHMRRTPEDAEI